MKSLSDTNDKLNEEVKELSDEVKAKTTRIQELERQATKDRLNNTVINTGDEEVHNPDELKRKLDSLTQETLALQEVIVSKDEQITCLSSDLGKAK